MGEISLQGQMLNIGGVALTLERYYQLWYELL
jgi:hypothetical protein